MAIQVNIDGNLYDYPEDGDTAGWGVDATNAFVQLVNVALTVGKLVNDLTTGGSNVPLTAEMGKVLNDQFLAQRKITDQGSGAEETFVSVAGSDGLTDNSVYLQSGTNAGVIETNTPELNLYTTNFARLGNSGGPQFTSSGGFLKMQSGNTAPNATPPDTDSFVLVRNTEVKINSNGDIDVDAGGASGSLPGGNIFINAGVGGSFPGNLEIGAGIGTTNRGNFLLTGGFINIRSLGGQKGIELDATGGSGLPAADQITLRAAARAARLTSQPANNSVPLAIATTQYVLDNAGVATTRITDNQAAGAETFVATADTASEVTIKAGDKTGTGGNINITAGNALNPSLGGGVTITAGDGSASGSGGDVTITAGGGTAFGGHVRINAGVGSVAGGIVLAAETTPKSPQNGQIDIISRNNINIFPETVTSGVAGNVLIHAGDGTGINGGNLELRAGNNTNNNGTGGTLTLRSGNGGGSQNGGALIMTTGDGLNTGSGGDFSLLTGAGSGGPSGGIKLQTNATGGGGKGGIRLGIGEATNPSNGQITFAATADSVRLTSQPTGAQALAVATTQYVDNGAVSKAKIKIVSGSPGSGEISWTGSGPYTATWNSGLSGVAEDYAVSVYDENRKAIGPSGLQDLDLSSLGAISIQSASNADVYIALVG